MRLAVSIYVLSGYDAAIAGEFVSSKVSDASDPGVQVRDLGLSMPLDSMLRLELPETKQDAQVHQSALRYIAEHKTFEHVSTANTEQGVAPSSKATAAQYLRVCDQFAGGNLNPGLRRSLCGQNPNPETSKRTKRTIRRWSRAFRQCWGLGFGSLQTGSDARGRGRREGRFFPSVGAKVVRVVRA